MSEFETILAEAEKKLQQVVGARVQLSVSLAPSVVSGMSYNWVGKPLRAGHERLLKLVCDEFDTTCEILKGGLKQAKLARARQVYACLAVKHLNMHAMDIANVLHRDRATILHCLRTVNSLIDVKDSSIFDTIKIIEQKFLNETTV